MKLSFGVLLVTSLGALPLSAQTTIHVPGDWPTIQEGINAALPGDTVLVAPGTYPEHDLDFLGKAITVRGAGGADVTIIDAQRLGRGFLFDEGEGPGSILEGFTITHGRAPATLDQGGVGGGIHITGCSPTIRSCVLLDNDLEYYLDPYGLKFAGMGGGMAILDGSPLIEGCAFQGNHSMDAPDGPSSSSGEDGGDAGGLFIEGGEPRVLACEFLGNIAGAASNGGAEPLHGYQGGAGGNGGAMAVYDSSPRIERCRFDGNVAGIAGLGSPAPQPGDGATGGDGGAGGSGGALYVKRGSPLLVGCTFEGNLTAGGGGGGSVGAVSGTDVIEGGEGGPGGSGGAIHVDAPDDPPLHVVGCRFEGNLTGDGGPGGETYQGLAFGGGGGAGGNGGAIAVAKGGLWLEHSVLRGNVAGMGAQGGEADGYFVNTGGAGGAGGSGGGLFLGTGSTRITNTVLAANAAGDGGKGGDITGTDPASLAGEGGAAGDGGGIHAAYSASAHLPLVARIELLHLDLVNGVVWSNLAGAPGAGGWPNGSIGQDSGAGGVLLANDEVLLRVRNAIVRGNEKDQLSAALSRVSYSDVEGGAPGLGNIDVDPGFVDPGAGDFHLAAGSPCIDTGDPVVRLLPRIDFEANPRVVGGRIDIGADEVLAYGSGVNPEDSLVLVESLPRVGGSYVLGIDNPLGTQGAGSLPFLALSLAPDAAFPAGTLLPDWGMGGAGADGELLIHFGGGDPVLLLAGPPWQSSGTPAPIVVSIPASPALLGLSLYAQGLLLDPNATFGVRLGLTSSLWHLISD